MARITINPAVLQTMAKTPRANFATAYFDAQKRGAEQAKAQSDAEYKSKSLEYQKAQVDAALEKIRKQKEKEGQETERNQLASEIYGMADGPEKTAKIQQYVQQGGNLDDLNLPTPKAPPQKLEIQRLMDLVNDPETSQEDRAIYQKLIDKKTSEGSGSETDATAKNSRWAFVETEPGSGKFEQKFITGNEIKSLQDKGHKVSSTGENPAETLGSLTGGNKKLTQNMVTQADTFGNTFDGLRATIKHLEGSDTIEGLVGVGASAINSFASQMSALNDMLFKAEGSGHRGAEVNGEAVSDSTLLDGSWMTPELRSKVKKAAVERGINESNLLQLAYVVARANDPNGRLSDSDVRNALNSLSGESWDKEVTISTLKNYEQKLSRQVDRYFNTRKMFYKLSDDFDLDMWRNMTTADQTLKREAPRTREHTVAESDARLRGYTPGQAKDSSTGEVVNVWFDQNGKIMGYRYE